MTPTPTLTEPKEQAQPQYEITEADKARQKAIQFAWQAYNGELEKPLKKMDDMPDDNVLSNRCKPAVRTGVGFLFGKELEISVEIDAPQEAQAAIDNAWGRKEARIPLLQKLAMNGAMAGSAFLRIVPGPNKTYRLVVVDPSIIYVQTAPQDVETVTLYCIEYSSVQKVNGKPATVFYREEISRIDPLYQSDNAEDTEASSMDTGVKWSIQHWTQVAANLQAPKNTGWTASGDPILWPYEFAPIFSCQNMVVPNDFWGEPDITPDLIGMNEALNLDLSDINRLQKIFGSPILYANGMGNSLLNVAPGKINELPLPESKISAVNVSSDTTNALAFSDDLRSDMDELTRVPGVATGRIKDMPRGNMSGIAIELLFMSLLMKTAEKRCTYGKLIIDVSKALLVLCGFGADIDVNLAWMNPLPEDDLQAAQAAVMKKQIGISNTTLQREMGYDPIEEAALNAEEAAQQQTQFSQGQGMPPISPLQPQPSMQPGMPPQPGAPAPLPAQPQAATAPMPAGVA